MLFEAEDGDKFELSEDWWRVRIDLLAVDKTKSTGFFIPQDLLKPIGEYLIEIADKDLDPNTNGDLERLGLDDWEIEGPL